MHFRDKFQTKIVGFRNVELLVMLTVTLNVTADSTSVFRECKEAHIILGYDELQISIFDPEISPGDHRDPKS